jgi:hypothetical protein
MGPRRREERSPDPRTIPQPSARLGIPSGSSSRARSPQGLSRRKLGEITKRRGQRSGSPGRSRSRSPDHQRRTPRSLEASEITKRRGQRSGSPGRSRSRSPDHQRRTPRSLEASGPEAQKVLFTSPQGVDPLAPNKLLTEAASRNDSRLEQANIEDENILGERHNYCSSDPNCFLPDPIVGPDDTFSPPTWFLREITVIAATPTPTPSKSSVRFDVSPEAAEHNASLLREIDYDFQQFFATQTGSTLDFGSEFRPVDQLRPLLYQHPGFEELAEVLVTGMPYRYSREITEDERETEVLAMLARGNHKSAQDEPEIVEKLLSKDVVHGFSMVIPKALVPLIPHAMVQPVGLATQWTLDDQGKRVIKYRITQDLSYSETSKRDFDYSNSPNSKKEPQMSINSRIDMDQYPEMVYGWALPRIIHFVVALRLAGPERTIFIAKYDYSDAYRRMAHSALAVVQTITTCLLLAFVYFRLTFGGSPNPPTWCNFSEMVTDLANEISMCQDWDPEELRSPNQPVTPKPKRLASSIPHAPAREMAVFIPPIESGKVDVFIDDLIDTYPDSPENLARKPHVVPLAMHVTSRPHAGVDEPILRRAILSLPKLLAEGAPAEQQIVLGWMLDTRRLLVSLPDDKYIAWISEIKNFIRRKGGAKEELETLEGQLNHAAYVIPLARHFLTRIRAAKNSRTNKKSWVKATPLFLADLVLWLELLRRANTGISMNLIVTRRPNRICWSDSCPFGLGGFSLRTGRAWRMRIPNESILYGSALINNLLEFVGMAVNIWLECLEADAHDCILALGDNTSAVGWLHNSSRLNTKWAAHEAHLVVARHVALLVLNAGCCLASQHIQGDLNTVADLLSFAGGMTRAGGKRHPIAFDDPPNDILTQRFHLYYSEQIPANFKISPLPKKISSWVLSVLQIAASYLTAESKRATNLTTELGGGGLVSAPRREEVLTLSSLNYPQSDENFSSDPSLSAFVRRNGKKEAAQLMESVKSQWSRALCAKPQATWLRRFGAICNQAPCTSRAHPSCSLPPAPSSRPLPMPTPHQNDSEPLLQNCCEACTS